MKRLAFLSNILVILLILSPVANAKGTQYPDVQIAVSEPIYGGTRMTFEALIIFNNLDLYNDSIYFSYHIESDTGEMLTFENPRYPVVIDEQGNGTVPFEINYASLPEEEQLNICFDLVDQENIYWFSRMTEYIEFTAPNLEIVNSELPRSDEAVVEITAGDPLCSPDQALIRTTVQFHDMTFYNDSIYLSYHIYDTNGNMLQFENQRILVSLDEDGQAVIPVIIHISDLQDFEDYENLRVEMDLVDQDNAFWFSRRTDIPFSSCDFSSQMLLGANGGLSGNWGIVLAVFVACALGVLAFLRIRAMTNWKERAKAVLPFTIFASFSFGAFFPGCLFAGNIDEFNLPSFLDIMPIVSITFFAGVVLLTTFILILPVRIAKIVSAILLGVGVAAYLQFNFLNADYGELNGTTIEWSRFSREGTISAVVWIACIIIPLLLLWSGWKQAIQAGRIVAAILASVQILTLLITAVTAHPKRTGTFELIYDDVFSVSRHDNMIVFVLDTWDASLFSQWLDENPDYTQKLDGFTYFDNTISGGAPTSLGLTTLLSGTQYELDKPYQDYWEDAYWETALYDDLVDNDFDIRMLTHSGFLSTKIGDKISNALFEQKKISSYWEFARLLYRLSLFTTVPQCMKEQFWLYSGDFMVYLTAKESSGETYDITNSEGDVAFYQHLTKSGISLMEKNAFRVYHLFGCHGPLRMNEDIQIVPEGQTSYTQQMEGSLKIVDTFLSYLKEENLYEDATIIITGDHGAIELYQNPAVLIKRSGDIEGFRQSHAPITFQDLHATMAAAFLDDYSNYGKTVYSIPENEKRDRFHSVASDRIKITFPEQSWDNGKYGCYRFLFKGDANDLSQVELFD